MHLVLIETSGNQAYIFATNKLRENVGASELTYRVGTSFVLNAVREAGGPNLLDTDPAVVRQNLRDGLRNPRLESSGGTVEVVQALSGKALLLVRDEETGRRIVRDVTHKALEKAPGVEVHGVVSGRFEFTETPLHAVVDQVYKEHERLRGQLPGPGQRFLRLPVVAECQSSGMPATAYDRDGPEAEPQPRSTTTLAKRKNSHPGLDRIRLIGRNDLRLARSAAELDDLKPDWLAVVHADGNGVGQIFQQFHKMAEAEGPDDNRKYLDRLRDFSVALDDCGEEAFRSAALALKARWLEDQRKRNRPVSADTPLPLVPLVLGGDDLTVLCDGGFAVQFTRDYLRAFDKATTANQAIADRARKRASGCPRLASCAGVAIVKPHFPFHAAYQLAEDLLKSAKRVKQYVKKQGEAWPCSALDFHMLYDASGAELERIRERLVVDDGDTHLTGRPYVVTPEVDRSGAEEGQAWASDHDFTTLEKRIAAIQARDDDRRPRLPSSMLHELREGLFLGSQEADARLALVFDRYREAGLAALLGDERSLFHPQTAPRSTALLDAMDLAEFWK